MHFCSFWVHPPPEAIERPRAPQNDARTLRSGPRTPRDAPDAPGRRRTPARLPGCLPCCPSVAPVLPPVLPQCCPSVDPVSGRQPGDSREAPGNTRRRPGDRFGICCDSGCSQAREVQPAGPATAYPDPSPVNSKASCKIMEALSVQLSSI